MVPTMEPVTGKTPEASLFFAKTHNQIQVGVSTAQSRTNEKYHRLKSGSSSGRGIKPEAVSSSKEDEAVFNQSDPSIINQHGKYFEVRRLRLYSTMILYHHAFVTELIC